MKPEELETLVITLRELGLTYDEAVSLMKGTLNDVKSLKSLWGKPGAKERKGSRLIKLGVSLIAFPIPTVGIKKSLGAMLIAAGLLQERRKHIHVSEVYGTFEDLNKEIQKLQEKLV